MKLLRSRKKFGRCACAGHGQCCEVTRNIRSVVTSRQTEKTERRREISEELEESVGRGGRTAMSRIKHAIGSPNEPQGDSHVLD